jgi:hypothetical protein
MIELIDPQPSNSDLFLGQIRPEPITMLGTG